MRYAICNETFEGWDHADVCRVVAELGYRGLEIAPFTLAPRITEVPAERRRELRRQAEDHGLQLIGLHWLLAKTKGLQLTSPDAAVRQATADYLVELARCCRDLGGDLLVFGSPAPAAHSRGRDRAQAADYAVDTFRRAAAGIRRCRRARSAWSRCRRRKPTSSTPPPKAIELLDRISHPNFVLHLDVKAMSTETERRHRS